MRWLAPGCQRVRPGAIDDGSGGRGRPQLRLPPTQAPSSRGISIVHRRAGTDAEDQTGNRVVNRLWPILLALAFAGAEEPQLRRLLPRLPLATAGRPFVTSCGS